MKSKKYYAKECHCQKKCACQNPISNNQILIWSGVAAVIGLGVYFLTKKPEQQPKSDFVFAIADGPIPFGLPTKIA